MASLEDFDAFRGASPTARLLATGALAAAGLFALCLLGIMTRPAASLAMVWPANAMALGLLLRLPADRRAVVWLAAPLAFMAADRLAGTDWTKAFLLNTANLCGVAAAYAVTRLIPQDALKMREPQSTLWLVLTAAAGATAAGLFAAMADPFLLGIGPFGEWAFWFAAELVNYVALLPLVLSMPPMQRVLSLHPSVSDWRTVLPAATLIGACAVALLTGGPGAIAFAVPALIWCGLAYSVFTVSALTFGFAFWSLITIRGEYLQGFAGPLDDGAIVSLRLAVFMLALAPVTLSIVMRNRDELVQKLSVARQRVDMALEAGGIGGTWELDVATGMLTVETTNPFPGEALYRAGQPAADVLANLIHPADRKRMRDAIALSIATGADCRCDYRTMAHDGEVRWFAAFGKPIFDQHNSVSRLSGVCINLTEQAKAAEALEISNKRFNIVSESIPEIVWSSGGDGVHDYFNRRWHEFTGIEPENIGPETWIDLIHPEDTHRAIEAWTTCLRTGQDYSIDYRFKYRDGSYRWLKVQAKPLRNAEGAIVRWYGTSTDIDDAKQLEAEREAVAHELDHRIGNLFALVNGLVNMSARDGDTGQAVADAIRGRLKALHDAHSLIRRADAGGATSMQGLLRTLLRPYDDGSGRVSIHGDDVEIAASAVTPMALVFHELATNAVKYGALRAEGGALHVTLRQRNDCLTIDWNEKCLSPAPAGEGSGFGSRLFKAVIDGQLRGQATRTATAEGLAIAVSLPLSSLAQEPRA